MYMHTAHIHLSSNIKDNFGKLVQEYQTTDDQGNGDDSTRTLKHVIICTQIQSNHQHQHTYRFIINVCTTRTREIAHLCQSFEFVSAISECSDRINVEGVFSLTNHWLPFFFTRYMNFLVRLLTVVCLNTAFYIKHTCTCKCTRHTFIYHPIL